MMNKFVTIFYFAIAIAIAVAIAFTTTTIPTTSSIIVVVAATVRVITSTSTSSLRSGKTSSSTNDSDSSHHHSSLLRRHRHRDLNLVSQCIDDDTLRYKKCQEMSMGWIGLDATPKRCNSNLPWGQDQLLKDYCLVLRATCVNPILILIHRHYKYQQKY